MSRAGEYLATAGLSSSRVRVQKKAAHDLDGLEAEGFDTVVLCDVTQHFPSTRYLRRCIEDAVGLIESPGYVFVGGVLSFPLMETYHSSVQLTNAPSSLATRHLRLR